ncbi:MAG: WYL domain-containing protein, partial [Planctomycetales bacterium]|nr:WYL domain-containing protein [Planctomycetales bacterium]
MARNEQLIRQHKLLQILERYRFGRTLDELRNDLVEELGLSSLHVRSVRRDMEALQAAGLDVGVHETRGRGKVWKLGPRFHGSHKIDASATELIALSLARDLLTPLAGTPFWIGIESFWNKIREILPASVWEHYQKFRDVLHVLGLPAKSYAKHQGTLKTINRAILEHRILEIAYQPLGQSQPSTRRIEPHGIVFYQGSLYVIADACEVAGGDERLRHLKLDRFRKATALDEWFKPRDEFHLERYLRE